MSKCASVPIGRRPLVLLSRAPLPNTHAMIHDQHEQSLRNATIRYQIRKSSLKSHPFGVHVVFLNRLVPGKPCRVSLCAYVWVYSALFAPAIDAKQLGTPTGRRSGRSSGPREACARACAPKGTNAHRYTTTSHTHENETGAQRITGRQAANQAPATPRAASPRRTHQNHQG